MGVYRAGSSPDRRPSAALKGCSTKNCSNYDHNRCFCFQIIIKYFLDALIQKTFFYIIKINNFRVELTDNSAKKEALNITQTYLWLNMFWRNARSRNYEIVAI